MGEKDTETHRDKRLTDRQTERQTYKQTDI
jgi:hypothetical protein